MTNRLHIHIIVIPQKTFIYVHVNSTGLHQSECKESESMSIVYTACEPVNVYNSNDNQYI